MVRAGRAVALATVIVVLGAAAATAHPVGSCLATGDSDRCESWSAVYAETPASSSARSDEFASAMAANNSTIFTTVKTTALDPSSPYEQTAAWVLVAHDRDSGELLWSTRRTDRPYESPLAIAVSDDGRRVYVTGSSYNKFFVNENVDAYIATVAYDAASGARLWSQAWDGQPNATDAGKEIAVSPDGRTVVIGGVTQGASGLDYVTVAYDATRGGRELWVRTVDGQQANATDSLNAIAMDPRGRFVVVTGESLGVAEFDLDYLTVAYDLRRGKVLWSQRYDGVGANKQDRAGAVTVSPDGARVYVTGNSWTSYEDGISQFDYATVAYAAAGGAQLWEARSAGAVRGFNAPIGIAATADRVVVTGQARGATTDDVRDFGTVAYDAASGAEAWRAWYAPGRHDDIALNMVLADDGSAVYVTGSSSPAVQYTDLDETATVAYRVADGAQLWASRLSMGTGNAVSPRALTATADGVALAATTTYSADPLKPSSQNIYDALIVAY